MSSDPIAGSAGLLAATLLGGTAAAQLGPHFRYEFTGGDVLDRLGTAVALVDDVDGDGHPDIAVGAPQSFQLRPGFVAIHSGWNGVELLRILGDEPDDPYGDRFGASVVALEDLDGDGVDELAIGAPGDDDGGFEIGSVAVHSGASGALLRRYGGAVAGERFGAALAAVGDVNGDGIGDLFVGAPGGALYAPGADGRVALLSGQWLAETLAGQPPSGPEVLFSRQGGPGFGSSLAAAGDFGGDGDLELLVGNPRAGVGGEVWILDGSSGGELARLTTAAADADLGRDLAALGDLGGDGPAEVAVGAPAFGPAGRVWVLEGQALAGLAGPTDIAGLTHHLVLDGAAPGERFGSALAGGGDFDGDGTLDLAVGASDGAGAGGGRGLVLSGVDGGVLLEVPGGASGALGGAALHLGGDLDFDGRDDLIVGRPHANAALGSTAVYSGGAAALVASGHELSVDSGGLVGFELWGGAATAGDFYALTASSSGTAPGTPFAGLTVPLVLDNYTLFSLGGPPEHVNFSGLLDGAGFATAGLNLAPDTHIGLVGSTLHFAYITIDLGPGFVGTLASNPVPVTLRFDLCTLSAGGADCNGNGVLDSCDIADGIETDCNANGVPDACELAAGTALDADFDGMIDSCQAVVFVDANATGSGDGSSWNDAYTDLSAALAAVPEFGQVWVAAGLYRPGPFPSPPETTFDLRDRVGLYGGFAGFEASLAERDPAANPTILDGDLAADDDSPAGSLADNVWSVVSADATVDPLTVLDGFTIRRGAADEFEKCDDVVAQFDRCRGSGLYAYGSPTVRDCIFEEHFAAYNGGAIYLAADARLVRCTIRSSTAKRGGAVYTDLGSKPLFVNCRFEGNQALNGGAIYANGNPGEGPRFVGCVFHANDAGEQGGAIFGTSGRVELAGCTVTANRAFFGVEGGLAGNFGATWQIDGTILWGNLGSIGVGATGGEGAQLDGLNATVSYSCIEGWSGGLGGAGNFGFDPLFVDLDGGDGVLGTADDDLRLAAASPCIDAGHGPALGLDVVDLDGDGNVAEPMPLDAAGFPRGVDDSATPDTGLAVFGLVPDVGAFERQP